MSQEPSITPDPVPASSPAASQTNGSPPPVPELPAKIVAQPGGRRWVLAVLVGATCGLPLGWLLSFGNQLMVLLGLYYYLLFGLILGAVMYRIGKARRPIRKRAMWTGTLVASIVVWAVALCVEAFGFPNQMADRALDRPRLPNRVDPDDYHAESARQIREHLRNKFSTDLPFSYFQWALTDSVIEPGVGNLPRRYIAGLRGVSGQFRIWWGLRVVLSLVFVTCAVYSQTRLLLKPYEARQRPHPATLAGLL